MIIAHITGTPGLWSELLSPPILVSKPNVVIGYNPIYEYAALPDVQRIVTAIKRSISAKYERAPESAGVDRAPSAEESKFAQRGSALPATTKTTEQHAQSITV